MLKTRQYHDRLIFNMGIPTPGKDGFYIEHIYQRFQSRPTSHPVRDSLIPISMQKSNIAPISPFVQPRKELDKVFLSPLRAWMSGHAVEGGHKVIFADISINLRGFRRTFQHGSYRVMYNVLNGLEGNLSPIISYCCQQIAIWEEIMRQIALIKVYTEVMKYIHHGMKCGIHFRRGRFLQMVEQSCLQMIGAHVTSAIINFSSTTINFDTMFIYKFGSNEPLFDISWQVEN